jgi:cardiolipin synthase A/B
MMGEAKMTQDSVKLFIGGEEAFSEIIRCINGAKKSIYINMFIWRDDVIGKLIASALIDAAERGVSIKISKDRLGLIFECSEENKQSFFHRKCCDRWYFLSFFMDWIYPMKGKKSRKKTKSNPLLEAMRSHKNIALDIHRTKKDHSKYYIIDERILFVGGMNIEDKERTMDVSGRQYYDYMVRYNGLEIVTMFRQRLQGTLEYRGTEGIDFMMNYVDKGVKKFPIRGQLLDFLSKATNQVTLVMAYIGDRRINNKLVELVKQGVHVTIVLPEKANLQHDFNMKQLCILLKLMNRHCDRKNISDIFRIYLSPKMIHAKLVLVDNDKISMGSTNLNKQGMDDLLELNTVLYLDTIETHSVKEKLLNSIHELKQQSTLITCSKEIRYNPIKAFFESLISS